MYIGILIWKVWVLPTNRKRKATEKKTDTHTYAERTKKRNNESNPVIYRKFFVSIRFTCLRFYLLHSCPLYAWSAHRNGFNIFMHSVQIHIQFHHAVKIQMETTNARTASSVANETTQHTVCLKGIFKWQSLTFVVYRNKKICCNASIRRVSKFKNHSSWEI